MSAYTQFKLANGDEIVAQVVQEPEGDDYNVVIRNAMMVVRSEALRDGFRYYSFRPWMSFQLEDEYLQLLNFNQIIGEAKPAKVLLSQYFKAIENEQDLEADSDVDNLKNIRRLVADLKSEPGYLDSDEDNVISLFDKDKLH